MHCVNDSNPAALLPVLRFVCFGAEDPPRAPPQALAFALIVMLAVASASPLQTEGAFGGNACVGGGVLALNAAIQSVS